MGYFFWLASIGFSVFAYAWPVSLLVVGWLVWAGAGAWRRRTVVEPAARRLLLLGFATPVLLLLYGTLHAAGPEWTPQPGAAIAPAVVYGALLVHLAVVATIAYRSRAGRSLILAAGMLQLWVAIGMGFVALMSVSGVWL